MRPDWKEGDRVETTLRSREDVSKTVWVKGTAEYVSVTATHVRFDSGGGKLAQNRSVRLAR